MIPLPADRPSQAIVDVSENMRAKIYSMFCKLGMEGFVHIHGDLGFEERLVSLRSTE